jgi:hypothetical protein
MAEQEEQMLVAAGFALGFVVGAKAGQEGLDEVVRSLKAIRDSDEFQAALDGLQTKAGLVVRKLVEQLTVRAGEEGSARPRRRSKAA